MIDFTTKRWLWAGRVMTFLIALFLLFDSMIHLLSLTQAVSAFTGLGYPVSVVIPLGVVELICLVLYVIPQTSVLGAILLTGYLGGAVASNLRVGATLFGTILFPVYVGILLWGGLYLRDGRLRALIPFRKS